MFDPQATSAQEVYEGTAAFQEYWAAMREAERMQGVWERYRNDWPAGHPERHRCYKAWRASVRRAQEMLDVCRKTPEHLLAFGW